MIYLNNTASSFPKPQEVIDAVNQNMLSAPCHGSRSGIEIEEGDIVYECRQALSKIINAKDPINIILTSGSTEALNLAIKGLNLNGGHIVSTAIEHNSVIRPLMTMKEAGDIELDFVDCDKWGYVKPEDIEAAIKDNTRAVVVNHCSNVTGTVLDLKAIAEIAHKHNCPIIVDASQSAGALPIDVQAWDIDYLALTGHKNLYGLSGTGALYMKETLVLNPLKVGGTGVQSEILVQPKEMPLYYEAGTPNLPGIASLKAGANFVLDKGIESIQKHKAELVDKMIKGLKDIPEITIYTSYENNSLSNFCFNVEGMVPEEVNYVMESSYDIHIRSGIHCAPLLLEAVGVHPWGTVRASPSYFTKDEDVDKFIKAIKETVATFCKKKVTA